MDNRPPTLLEKSSEVLTTRNRLSPLGLILITYICSIIILLFLLHFSTRNPTRVEYYIAVNSPYSYHLSFEYPLTKPPKYDKFVLYER